MSKRDPSAGVAAGSRICSSAAPLLLMRQGRKSRDTGSFFKERTCEIDFSTPSESGEILQGLEPQAYFFTACAAFCLAQRRFWAAAIRARASGLRIRFFLGRLPNDGVEIPELPELCNRARTFSRRLISSSTAAINSSRVIFLSFYVRQKLIQGTGYNVPTIAKPNEMLQNNFVDCGHLRCNANGGTSVMHLPRICRSFLLV
jgi:hypothetical protein